MRFPFSTPTYVRLINSHMLSSVCSDRARSMFTHLEPSGISFGSICFWLTNSTEMALTSGSWLALPMRCYRVAIVKWGYIFHCMTTSISWISAPIPAASMHHSLVPILLLSLVKWYVPVQTRTLDSPSLKLFNHSSRKLTARDAWKGLKTILRYSAIEEDSPSERYIDMSIHWSIVSTKIIDCGFHQAALVMGTIADSCV